MLEIETELVIEQSSEKLLSLLICVLLLMEGRLNGLSTKTKKRKLARDMWITDNCMPFLIIWSLYATMLFNVLGFTSSAAVDSENAHT